MRTMKSQDNPRPIRKALGSGLGIIVLAALLLEIAAFSQYDYTRKILEEQLENNVAMTLESAADIIGNTLKSAEATMQEHVWDIQSHLSCPDSMFNVTRRLISSNPNIVGGNIAFVPGFYKEKGRLFEPYAYKLDSEIVVEQIAGDGHDYTQHPAYQEVASTGKDTWSDPYIYDGASGPVSLTTYTYPLYDSDGSLAALCGLDIDLTWLGDTLNARHYFPSSFSLMLTSAGESVAEPSNKQNINQIVDLIREDNTSGSPAFKGIRTIRFRDSSNGKKAYIHYMPMDRDPHWQIANVSYNKEIYAPARKMRFRIFLMNVFGSLILLFIIGRFARNRRKLHFAEVEQARIGSELQIARNIQMQMLPKVFPPYPERDDIDIFGSVEPAKEIGGDLFDFFIKDEKLFFCIGDVSGKGVPAAIVMAETHSLFRMASDHEDQPAEIMRVLNEEGCRGNESNVFVTFFIGVLDLQDGRLRYCNAGHERPIVLTGTAEELKVESNLPLGIFTDCTFKQQEIVLPAPSLLFLYTDGLTEARDPGRKQYTFARLLEVLGRHGASSGITAAGLVNAVGYSVDRFMDGCGQTDDLTMLAIRYSPSPKAHDN